MKPFQLSPSLPNLPILTDPFLRHTIIPIIVFWLILWGLGFPPPSVDDLFFVGTADHLFKTGELVNPLLRFWTDRAINHYYLHTPIYPYTLAAWFVLFGINTQSLLLFQCCCAIVFSIATAGLLRHYQFSQLATLLVPIIYSLVWFSNSGLRHDGYGMALLATGLWFLTQNHRLQTISGFCCLGLAVLVYPQLIAYSLPFTGGILIHRWLQEKHQNQGLKFIQKTTACLLTAMLFVGALFLVLINFNLSEFLSDFLWHSSLSRSQFDQFLNIQGSLQLIYHYVKLGYNPIIFGSLYLLYGACLLSLIIAPQAFSPRVKGVALTLFIGLLLNLYIYSNNWIYGAFDFFVWVSILLIITELKKKIFYALFLGVFLIYQSISIVAFLGQEMTPKADYSAILNTLELASVENIIIDSVAARFIFNYQIPDRSIDYIFYGPAPKFSPETLDPKKDDEIWIVGRRNVLFMELSDAQKVNLFGHQFGSILRRPNDVVVFR
jgi:hypothetical protein